MNADVSVPPPISFPLPRKRRLFTAFEIVVVVLGLVALAYLVSTLMQPKLVAQILGSTYGSKVATTATDRLAKPEPPRDLAKALPEIVALHRSLGELQTDLDNLKSEAQSQSERDAAIAARVAALEQGTSEAPPSTAADAAPTAAQSPAMAQVERALANVDDTSKPGATPQAVPAAQTPAATAADKAVESDAAATNSAPAPKLGAVELPPTPGAIVTGSVSEQPAAAETKSPPAASATVINAPVVEAKKAADAKAPSEAPANKAPAGKAPAAKPQKVAASKAAPPSDVVAFGPPIVSKVKVPEEVVGVRIGRYRSIDDARLRWMIVATEQGETLKNLEGRYVGGVDADGSVDLVAGPINSTTEARKVCKSLQARGLDCSVGPFIGNAL